MKTYKVIFMAFAVMVLGAFVITSCSNEEEHTTPNQNNRREMNELIEELRQEWQSISSSVEYLEFLASVEYFGSKLPPEATPYLDDRDMMLSWIDTNISLTGFNNFSEAESELNAVETRYLDIMVANEGFFQDVNLVDNPYIDTDIFFPFPFQPETPVTNGGPCHNACINEAVACGRAVDNTYALAMEAADTAYKLGNLQLAVVLAATATVAQHAGQRACANALMDCYEGCE